MGSVKIMVHAWQKIGVALLIAGILWAHPAGQAQAAVRPLARPGLCGVAQPFGQTMSHIVYLYDGPNNYSYGYQIRLSLWKDRCPLAYGAASVQSFDVGAPEGKLSVSVYNCDTKLGGFTRTQATPAGAGVTSVVSSTVPVGPYYFVQAYYVNHSGTGEMVFQTSTCIATP